jgi:predicted CXXCH cytochrome family protein
LERVDPLVVSPALDRLWLVTLAALALGGCSGAHPRLPMDVTQSRAPAAAATVASNVLRGDYVGSAACTACHADVVATWRRSPMHRMTRLPEQAEVRAPFDGREFRFKGDTARFEQVAGTRFVRLSAADQPERIYRVTKVIGGRYREDFAGLQVEAALPDAAVIGDPGAELILPASYVFQTASFRLKGYSVMVGERPGLRAGGVWNQTCIFCHNTVPYFDDLWSALHGPGSPPYQGEVVDRVLPPGRRMRYVVTDAGALTRALDHEIALLGGAVTAASGVVAIPSEATAAESARALLRRAMGEARSRFQPRHFIEVGIGCEACHGGSREHVDDPGRHPTFEPRAAFLKIIPRAAQKRADTDSGANARADAHADVSAAEWQNRACARCHQVLFSRYPRTWEGGSRRVPGEAGGSHISSGEARDFLLGACARAMTCTTCHDPHGEDRRDRMVELSTPAGNGVCTGCHQKLGTPAALKAHAHHDPAGAGGSCVACHMPKKNMGLGYGLTRYHRIGSPTDPERVERDRPMECALCHAEKTVGRLLDDIARLWDKRYDDNAIRRLYGTRDANVLVSTIERGHGHEQAAAMGAAGEQRFQPAAPAIAREIDGNVYPLVRYYAAAALAAIQGKPIPADLEAASSILSHPTAQPAGMPATPPVTSSPHRRNTAAGGGGPGDVSGDDED